MFINITYDLIVNIEQCSARELAQAFRTNQAKLDFSSLSGAKTIENGRWVFPMSCCGLCL